MNWWNSTWDCTSARINAVVSIKTLRRSLHCNQNVKPSNDVVSAEAVSSNSCIVEVQFHELRLNVNKEVNSSGPLIQLGRASSPSLWCYYIVWRVVHCVDEKDSFTNTSTQDILLTRLKSWNVRSILHILTFFLKCMMTKTRPPLIRFSPRGSDTQFVSEVLGCPHIFSHTHRGWHSSPITGGQHLRLSQSEWTVCACVHTSVNLLFDNHMPARPRGNQPDV